MDIASNIKSVRRAKNITPTMMAKELGIEASNYPKFENRGNQLTYSNLESISKALGITVIELITWEDKKEYDSLEKQSIKGLQSQIKELTTARDIAQEYVNVLNRKVTYISYAFILAIRRIGDAADLGTEHLIEDDDLYVLHHKTFTDKELLKIFEIMYNNESVLYFVFRDLIQKDIINASGREEKIFLKFDDQIVNTKYK